MVKKLLQKLSKQSVSTSKELEIFTCISFLASPTRIDSVHGPLLVLSWFLLCLGMMLLVPSLAIAILYIWFKLWTRTDLEVIYSTVPSHAYCPVVLMVQYMGDMLHVNVNITKSNLFKKYESHLLCIASSKQTIRMGWHCTIVCNCGAKKTKNKTETLPW